MSGNNTVAPHGGSPGGELVHGSERGDLNGERQVFAEDIIHHPDAYTLARRLAPRLGADHIIDIGLGSLRQLMGSTGLHKIAIDHGPHMGLCRKDFAEHDWIERDLEARWDDLGVDDETLSRSVVVCARTLERLADPRSLLDTLSRIARRAPAVIITATERDLTDEWGQTAKWNGAEFEQLLRAHGLAPSLTGLTV